MSRSAVHRARIAYAGALRASQYRPPVQATHHGQIVQTRDGLFHAAVISNLHVFDLGGFVGSCVRPNERTYAVADQKLAASKAQTLKGRFQSLADAEAFLIENSGEVIC